MHQNSRRWLRGHSLAKRSRDGQNIHHACHRMVGSKARKASHYYSPKKKKRKTKEKKKKEKRKKNNPVNSNKQKQASTIEAREGGEGGERVGARTVPVPVPVVVPGTLTESESVRAESVRAVETGAEAVRASTGIGRNNPPPQVKNHLKHQSPRDGQR